MNLTILRTCYDVDVTEGEWLDENKNHICYSLELPDKDNAPEISCIPEGIYPYVKFNSPHLGLVLRLENVPGRSLIDAHAANTVLDLHGCIGSGLTRGTLVIGGKVYPAVLSSRAAMVKLLAIAGNSGTITITSEADANQG